LLDLNNTYDLDKIDPIYAIPKNVIQEKLPHLKIDA
jgi:hypothetical protein